MIVGKMTLLRSDDEIISYNVCTDKKEQDNEFYVYHIDVPIISKAVESHKNNLKNFILNKYSYTILDIKILDIFNNDFGKEKIISLEKTAVIHLVSQQSFGDIKFHCPSCRTEGAGTVEVVTVMLERLSSSKNKIPFQGVLNCKRCGYFFANKHMFEEFLKKYKYDIVAPRKDIKIKNNNIFYSSNWNGAADSPLSRYGYTADGTLNDKKRREVISYLVTNKITSIHSIQNLLSGFLYGRKKRNPNAARIWQSDLDWLNKNFSSGKNYNGFISDF